MKQALAWCVLLTACSAGAARADAIISFPQPDSAYTSSTALLAITDFDETPVVSLSSGLLGIAFSTEMRVSTVGDDWGTWNSPPATESATPHVLWTEGVTSVAFFFSSPLSAFGIEAEPADSSIHSMTLQFLDDGNFVGQVVRSIDGDGGALLLAGAGGVFDEAILSSDIDFAAGQFRYTLAPVSPAPSIPEPPSAWLALIGMAVWLGPRIGNRWRSGCFAARQFPARLPVSTSKSVAQSLGMSSPNT